MINSRLTTSLDVEKKIIELQKLLKLSTKASVMRIAIGLSLRVKEDPRDIYNEKNNDHIFDLDSVNLLFVSNRYSL